MREPCNISIIKFLPNEGNTLEITDLLKHLSASGPGFSFIFQAVSRAETRWPKAYSSFENQLRALFEEHPSRQRQGCSGVFCLLFSLSRQRCVLIPRRLAH